MNLVGEQGKGESVWLAFFLYDVLKHFAAARAKSRRRCVCRINATTKRQACARISRSMPGTDNGIAAPISTTAIRSAPPAIPNVRSIRCRKAGPCSPGSGDPERARSAMDAVAQRLVRRQAGLIQLFDPPFDKSSLEPGYIKGYVPGVRENGGQYTHAAIWTVMAFAGMGDVEARVGTVRSHQSDPACADSGRGRPLQSRAVRRGRRRLQRAAAYRPRRVDLVHGIGRMVVSVDHRNASWVSRLEVDKLSFPSARPGGLEIVQGSLPLSRNDIITFPCSRSRRFLPVDNESSSMAPNSRMGLCD